MSYFANLKAAILGKTSESAPADAPTPAKTEVKTVRRTALSAELKTKTKTVKVDAVEKRHSDLIEGFKEVAESPVLKEQLGHLKNITQEKVNAEFCYDAVVKAEKRQVAIENAFKSIKLSQMEMALSLVELSEKTAEKATVVREKALANQAEGRKPLLSIKDLADKAKALAKVTTDEAPVVEEAVTAVAESPKAPAQEKAPKQEEVNTLPEPINGETPAQAG